MMPAILVAIALIGGGFVGLLIFMILDELDKW